MSYIHTITPTRNTWWGTLRSYILGPFTSSEIKGLHDAGNVAAGVSVSEESALTLAAVWNAVQLISGTVGSLPLVLYKRLPNGGREPFIKHPLYRLLHDRPNPEMSSMVFRETLQAHVLLWGNAYAEIQRDNGNRVSALWPIAPNRVAVKRDAARRLYYEVQNTLGQPPTRLSPMEVLHIPGLGFDGVQGYSVIGKARESYGMSIATERFAAQFFGNSTVIGGNFKTPNKLSDTAYSRLEQKLADRRMSGEKGAHRALILEEGLAWERMSIPPEDAQFLETRTFQILEICRWFNTPPHKLKEMSHATFTNIEHQATEWVTDTLMPWFIRWEKELDYKLIAPVEYGLQYFKHNINGLLRGDMAARKDFYASGRQWGYFSANDVRGWEELNPLPGDQGEMYLVPANMIPADKVGQLIESQNVLPAKVNESEEPKEPERAAPMNEVRTMPAANSTNGHVPELRLAPEPPAIKPKVISAQRAMILDVVGRMVRREACKARRAGKSADRLLAWLRGFYPHHAEVFRSALLPAIQAHLAMIGSDEDPRQATAMIVDDYIRDSRAAIEALCCEPEPETLTDAVNTLMTKWERERPSEIADQILEEEISHAVS